jgi:hypothetical protein
MGGLGWQELVILLAISLVMLVMLGFGLLL